MTAFELRSLTWPEAQRIGAAGDAIGLIATAAVEQHGPHLPLATDFLLGEALALRVAAALLEPVVVAPVLPGGLSSHHLAFPGSVDLPETVVDGYLSAYVDAFAKMGIDRIAIFSAHGGNFAFIERFAATLAERGEGPRVVAYGDLNAYAAAMHAGAATAGVTAVDADMHAGCLETSQLLASHPDLVRPFTGVTGYTANEPGWPERARAEGLDTITTTGVLGDVAGATAEAGEGIYTSLTDLLAGWMADELGATLLASVHRQTRC